MPPHRRQHSAVSTLALACVLQFASGCGERTVLLGRHLGEGGAANSSDRADAAAGNAGSGARTTYAPEPQRVANVDISAGGPYTRLLVGDLDGDGRFDLLTMQPDVIDDNELPHSVVALTAFDVNGTQLWQVGTPDPNAEASASDIPAQIYDIDGDGDNEVLAVMAGKLQILDGKTGRAEDEHELPEPNAHDAIIIANLSGHAHPDDIILKNRYNKLWAYNRKFELLFTFAGETGYFPWPYDWNGDGRDEIVAGGHFLNSDGKEVWNCVADTDTTVDAVWAGDLDPAAENGAEVIIGGGNTLAYHSDGTKLFAVNTVEAQNIAVGDFRPELPGLEVAGLDRINRTANGYDGMFLVSSKGTVLWQEERPAGSGWSTILGMLSNWDGSDNDGILAYGRNNEQPTLYDGKFNVVATFPESSALLMVADLCGDERDEILAYTDQFVHVYSTGNCPLASHVTHVPRPQPKALYNWTRYWGGEAP